jgi:anti-sigma regulatory factor (Ser/Thr protein kinase)
MSSNVLAEWGLPSDTEAADTIRLIVSELATNAVQHTFGQSPTFTVDIELDRDEQLRIGVTDSHPASRNAARRRPAGQRPRHGDRPLADGECGGKLTVRPTREGGKTVSIMLPWTAPVQPVTAD